MDDFLPDVAHEFRRHKGLADRAMAELDDAQFLHRPGALVNPVALIVKHLAGNLVSRWADFLTTDGEKASRDRDGEFLITESDTRSSLMAAWERGWSTLFDTLAGLKESDLVRTVTIRGEPHSVRQALLRSMTHAAYHTGQIVYLVRWIRPESPWLTIPPGQSRGVGGAYRRA
jgi:uncharacterized damage-inducible protein DinB